LKKTILIRIFFLLSTLGPKQNPKKKQFQTHSMLILSWAKLNNFSQKNTQRLCPSLINLNIKYTDVQ